MERKILRIKDAYSSQPTIVEVSRIDEESLSTKARQRLVKEICFERMEFVFDDDEEFETHYVYCAYNFDGQLLHHFESDSVNVDYYYD